MLLSSDKFRLAGFVLIRVLRDSEARVALTEFKIRKP